MKKKRGKQMSSEYERDVGRISNHTGQWRPFSYSVGHKLRPPSRTLWTDPDYPSGSNPQRPPLPGCFPPKRLTSVDRDRHCAPKLWKLTSQRVLTTERDPKSTLFPYAYPSPRTPHRHTWESKGAQPHPRNPAQYPGISCGPSSCPFSPSC